MSEFRYTGRKLIEEGEAIKVGDTVLQPVTEVDVYEVPEGTIDALEGKKSDGGTEESS